MNPIQSKCKDESNQIKSNVKMKSRQRRSHIIPELTLSNHIINKLLSTETGECSQGSTQRAANGVPGWRIWVVRI